MDSIGAYLRALREAAKLSLRDVEGRCNISNGYLSLLEHDKVKEPSPRILWQLALCYQTDYMDLMQQAGYPVPDNPAPQSESNRQLSMAFRGAEQLSKDDLADVQAILRAVIQEKLNRPKKDESR